MAYGALVLLILSGVVFSDGRPQREGGSPVAPVEEVRTPLLGGNLYAWIFTAPGVGLPQSLVSGLPLNHNHNTRQAGGISSLKVVPLPVAEVGSGVESNVAPVLKQVVTRMFGPKPARGVVALAQDKKPEEFVEVDLGRAELTARPVEGLPFVGSQGVTTFVGGGRPYVAGDIGIRGGGQVTGGGVTGGLPLTTQFAGAAPLGGRQLLYVPSDTNYVYPNTFNYANGLYTLIPYNYGGVGYPFGSYVSANPNQLLS